MTDSYNIIISIFFLLIMVFIINRETFNITKVDTTPIIIPDDVQLNNYAPAIKTDEVNLSPLLQYTAATIQPKIISSNNIVSNKLNFIPASNEVANNYAPVNKKDISITNDILTPIGNFIVNTLKNPPGPSSEELQKPKKELSITKDIINPIVNVITNQVKEPENVLKKLNDKPLETQVYEPHPNIIGETGNFYFLDSNETELNKL